MDDSREINRIGSYLAISIGLKRNMSRYLPFGFKCRCGTAVVLEALGATLLVHCEILDYRADS
jgi:hypothetical protein